MENIKFLAKYPFLEEAKEYISKKNLSIEEISSHPIYSHAIEIARKRIEEGINGEINPVLKSELDCERWLISYPIAKIILSSAHLAPHLIKKYAESEATLAIQFLEKEKDEKKEIILRNMINCERYGNSNKMFKIYFVEYLKHATKIEEERFRLVNRKLEKGYILIDDSDLMKLVKEEIKEKFEALVDIKNIPAKINEVAKTLKTLETYKNISTPSTLSTISAISTQKKEIFDYPPCIISLIEKIKTDEASHQGRFVLSTYLINAGMSNEEIKKIFALSPKYDEKKTSYYLDYLSGKKGKKYSCPTCAKIKALGCCVSECKIKHPLQYKKDKI